MLKYSLGAALAAIISTSFNGVLALPQAEASEEMREDTIASVSSSQFVADTAMAASLNRSSQNQVDFGTMLGIAAVGAGTAGLIWSQTKSNVKFSPSSQDRSLQVEPNPQLQKKLLRLLHNDKATANRLLAGARITHPDKSANWLAEKVIYDLERDLGRY